MSGLGGRWWSRGTELWADLWGDLWGRVCACPLARVPPPPSRPSRRSCRPPQPRPRSYEQFKRGYQTLVLRGQRDLTPPEHSMFGAVAGAFTGLVTTPLDVLKTRMMLAGASGKRGLRGKDV